MNVMEITSGQGVCGAVVHCLLLTRGLLRRGHEITLVCRHDAWIARQLAGQPVHIIESDMRRFPPTELRRVADIARERRIDVAHTHMTGAHSFGAWLRRLYGVPCVATASANTVQPCWTMVDRVIAVSEATRRYHRTHNLLPARKIVTVHGCADCAHLANLPPGPSVAARSDLGLPSDAPTLGIVADIVRRKGHIHLVRALPQIIEAFPDVRLLVVGAPKDVDQYHRSVQDEARRLGVAHAIHWAGYRSDIARVMSALDIYVLPSLAEVFPIALIEAMAAARPVVATRVGGVPECVVHEETGIMIRPCDPSAIARAAIGLLRGPARGLRMGDAARRSATELFSVESQAPRVERELAVVADRASRWRCRRRTA
jgi:L-malate glycosyltransferase